jgi:hypothetical protein
LLNIKKLNFERVVEVERILEEEEKEISFSFLKLRMF